MFQLLLPAIAGLIIAISLFTGTFSTANYDTAAVSDSPAPESVFYGVGASSATAASMTTAISTSMGSYKLTNIEQALVDICRATYYMGKANNCSPLNEAMTWNFLFQNGNTGSLNTVQGLTASSSFSCTHPEQYGVYLLNNSYSATALAGHTYNLNKSDGSGAISGQADPCAYADLVN